jgi:hypothetical protein
VTTTAATTTPFLSNPAAQLAPLSPFGSLAATNPNAALTALSPSLNILNPAINPNAAFLAANPAAAPTLALGSVQGPATLPFGKFPWGKYGKLPYIPPFLPPFGLGPIPFPPPFIPFGKIPFGFFGKIPGGVAGGGGSSSSAGFGGGFGKI